MITTSVIIPTVSGLYRPTGLLFSEWDTEFQQWFILHVSWYEGVTWAHAHDGDDSDANNNSDDNVNDNDNENDNEKVFTAK